MSEDTAAMEHEGLRDTDAAQEYYQRGQKAEDAGDREGAIGAYEAAYTADPEDSRVCFRLAYNLDLKGEEDEALHLYEEVVRQEQPPLNALVNLAILYEDREKYAHAERCIQQVLTTQPKHERARLYLKDIAASKDMVIDDEQERRLEKANALLDTPVTDFDLSVRTRNALKKMSIRTLGDLLRVTESELQSYRNFGDQSIEEIRAMLAQRGLYLGQAAEEQQQAAKQQIYDEMNESGNQELLSKSVNELDLSVRARKALAMLNVQTIGDLVMKTEAELMGVKNFGMTSLLEVREKLTQAGLSLRKLQRGEEAAETEGVGVSEVEDESEAGDGDGDESSSGDAES